jgi:hypothetical protein
LSGTLATDNSGLLTRVRQQQKTQYPIPNAIFQSDWDIVEAIVLTVEQTKMEVEYKWVKGHQDNETEYADLPLTSQLNIDADKLAGDYLSDFGTNRPAIPLSPTRPIALDINGITIHRYMKSAIREAAHTEPLLKRLKDRYQWDDHVPRSIDWDAHRLATTSSHPTKKTHFVKLCHDYLPAGKIAHRHNPTYPSSCPLCNHPNEDHQHILQCHHSTRRNWRKELLQKIRKQCDATNTDPVIKAILVNGLTSWLDDVPPDFRGIPSEYHELIESQTAIGWYHILLARMSTQWSSYQEKFLRQHTNRHKSLSGKKWTRQICTIIITSWLDLWTKRNTERHGVDSTQRATQLHQQAVREIETLYLLKNSVLQRDGDIFSKDITYHTNGTTHYIRQWINTHQPAILHSTKKAKLLTTLNVRPISSYFTKQ